MKTQKKDQELEPLSRLWRTSGQNQGKLEGLQSIGFPYHSSYTKTGIKEKCLGIYQLSRGDSCKEDRQVKGES